MFRFEYPSFLYLLFVIPILTFLFAFALRRVRKRKAVLGDTSLINRLVNGFSRWRGVIKFSLTMIGLALVIVALARPRFGTNVETVNKAGVEVMIAMDISNSMLAEDVSPNRLARAKRLVSNIIDKMDNDKIGLVVFAGDAFIQLPLTGDYPAAKMLLESLSPNMISGQGTNVAQALELGRSAFSKDKEVGKAILLITDGENHEEGALEAAESTRKQGINLFVLGVGTPEGAPIPLDGTYIKDEGGNTVMSALNETMCRELAQAGGGDYVRVDNSMLAQEKTLSDLSQLKKAETEAVSYSDYAEQFQAFALLALIILAIDMLMSERAGNMLKKLKLFDK